jgi:AcrR family transcriptional regulator
LKQLSRKEREQKRRQQEILEAALTVFAEKGFFGATMAEISQISEYPLGTIYKFFSGKEQIFHDMVVQKGYRLGNILYKKSLLTELSPKDRIRECIVATAKYLQNNKDFIRVYVSLRSSIDVVLVPELNRNINNMHEKMVNLYTNLFQEGIDAGQYKNYKAYDMAVLLSGIMFTSVWPWLNDTEEETDNIEKRVETGLDIFSNGSCK